MKGNELLKKLRKLARERQLHLERIQGRGKGSHSTLKLNGRRTILKDPKKEIGEGLLKSMLADLGLTKDDIEM